MSRDKQIEEMAIDLSGTWVVDLEGNPHDLSEVLMQCDIESIAEQLCSLNYLKSTDLAEEIFAEIDTLFEKHFKIYRDRGRDVDLEMVAKHSARFSINELWGDIIELKKKYTKSEGGE